MRVKQYSAEKEIKIRLEALNVAIEKNGLIFIRVQGASMCPLIRDEDTVAIKAVSYEEILIGNIIAVKSKDYPKSIIVHRVIGKSKKDNTVITKGDNACSKHCDEPTGAGLIVGRVVTIKRGEDIISIDGRLWRLAGYVIAKLARYAPFIVRPFLMILSLFSIPKKVIPKISAFISRFPKKEDLFLLRFCAGNFIAADLKEQLIKQLDWEHIYGESLKTETAVLLYLNLKKTGLIFHLPQKIAENLKNAYLFNTTCNVNFLDGFERIMAVLTAGNVKTAPLKGLSLLLDIYPDIGMRALCDLDLLSKIEDKPKIISIFKTLGYKTSQEPEGVKDILGSHHIIFKRKDVFPSNVEVHFRLFAKYLGAFQEAEDSFKNLRPIIWKNIEIYKMHPQDELLYLFLSYYLNDFAWIKYLFDADALLKKYPEFDWMDFLKSIKERNLTPRVSYAVFFLKKYLNAPIPDYCKIWEIPARLERQMLKASLFNTPISKWQIRYLRLKHKNSLKEKVDEIGDGFIWHLYKRFGFFSDYMMKKYS
ncbi:MAG: nucleotidyltransferase family protein [Candidatus Omnitrophica bacterium]|nr:nucleotidyltransferase family protein [Candidatus Omnitrophota bacterium]